MVPLILDVSGILAWQTAKKLLKISTLSPFILKGYTRDKNVINTLMFNQWINLLCIKALQDPKPFRLRQAYKQKRKNNFGFVFF